MAEFKEVIKQFNRMCYGHIWCVNCQIDDNRGPYVCSRWLTENPTKAEEIVMQWAKEHQPVTNRNKFKEVFGFDPITDRLDAVAWFEAEYKEPKDE